MVTENRRVNEENKKKSRKLTFLVFFFAFIATIMVAIWAAILIDGAEFVLLPLILGIIGYIIAVVLAILNRIQNITT